MNEANSLVQIRTVSVGDQPPLIQHTSLEPRVATGSRHASGGLKSMGDSMTLLSTQGVYTSSTRSSMDAVVRAHGSPFSAVQSYHLPGALHAETCMVPGISWPCSSVTLDFPMAGWPGVAARCCRIPLYGGRTAPRSNSTQSETSKYNGPPTFCTPEDAYPSVFSVRSNGGKHSAPLQRHQPRIITGHVPPASNQVQAQLPFSYSTTSQCSNDTGFYCSSSKAPSASLQNQALRTVTGQDPQDFSKSRSNDLCSNLQPPQIQPFPHPVQLPQTRPQPRTRNTHLDSRKDRVHLSPRRIRSKRSKRDGSIHVEGYNKTPSPLRMQSNSSKSEGTSVSSDKLQRTPASLKADSDVVSSSTGSPRTGSPTLQLKSKIDVKVSVDGQLVFNARQRRTLRRALQRQRKLEIDDGTEFTADGVLSEAESQIVIDVVQLHIGRPLPQGTEVHDLVKMLLNLGTSEGEA